MQSLSSYLKSRTTEFTAGGTRSKKVLIFDLDDTIINTSANIKVLKNGREIKTISNKDFNNYILKPGESFDFTEFNDREILSKETFTKYWRTLKREYLRGVHICILTARNDCDMIRDFFLQNGINIKLALIIAVNDPRLGLNGNIHERKAQSIQYLHKLGYDTMIFFDDNKENLEAAKALEKSITDIKIHTIQA